MAADKRALFITEYVKDCNGAQAAIRAGFAKKHANNTAARLLANVTIRAKVDDILAKKAAERGLNAEKMLKEGESLAFSDLGDVLDFNTDGAPQIKPSKEINDRARRAIKRIKVKTYTSPTGVITQEVEVEMHAKLPAWIELAKYVQMPEATKAPMKLDITCGGKKLELNSHESISAATLAILDKFERRIAGGKGSDQAGG